LAQSLPFVAFVQQDRAHFLPWLVEECPPFARGDDALRHPSFADALCVREAAALGIGVDLRHDAPHHLEAAAIDLLVGSHGWIVAFLRKTARPRAVENLRVSFCRGNLGVKEEAMSKRLRALKREIERRGGRVGMAPDLPDEVAELFLREILDCPDCLEEARKMRTRESRREH